MKPDKRHKELAFTLSQRGAKKRIADKTGLSVKTLYNLQSGTTDPTEGTLRLIAGALGLAEDYFLDSKADSKTPVQRRLVVEIDLPKDADLTERDLKRIRRAMLDAGRHIINVINDIDSDN